MCDYTQREYSCGHFRWIASKWCRKYTITHARCEPNVTHFEYRAEEVCGRRVQAEGVPPVGEPDQAPQAAANPLKKLTAGLESNQIWGAVTSPRHMAGGGVSWTLASLSAISCSDLFTPPLPPLLIK